MPLVFIGSLASASTWAAASSALILPSRLRGALAFGSVFFPVAFLVAWGFADFGAFFAVVFFVDIVRLLRKRGSRNKISRRAPPVGWSGRLVTHHAGFCVGRRGPFPRPARPIRSRTPGRPPPPCPRTRSPSGR